MENIVSFLTKLLALKIAALILLLNFAIYGEEVLLDFCKENSKSIMCDNYKLPPSFSECEKRYGGQPKPLNMTPAEQKNILAIVNELRDEIAGGTKKIKNMSGVSATLPQASSMTVMEWDDDLAVAASKKIMACRPYNLPVEDTKFGIHQAMAVHTFIRSTEKKSLNFNITRIFDAEASRYKISLLENYPTNEEYDFFTILAHHSSLFIGCAKSFAPNFKVFWIFHIGNKKISGHIYLVCYLAPSENETHNMLYKQGKPCSDCPFKNVGEKFGCNKKYKNLCNRPSWPLSDSRMQNASILEGFNTESTTTSTTTTTTSTTPSTTTTSTTPSTTTTTTSTTPSTTTTTTTTSPITNAEQKLLPPGPTDEDLIFPGKSDEPTSTTELTTTKSDQSGDDGSSGPPMLVPSRYLHMIICVCFLVGNIHME